jgi:activator of 2-hydroxyglutaryl-CoA dehydratase
VISLTNQGAERNEVALGIHKAIISRSVSILKRVAPPGSIFFAGGVALNECVRIHLAAEMGRQIIVPEDPQMVGAIGAALYAATQMDQKRRTAVGGGIAT